MIIYKLPLDLGKVCEKGKLIQTNVKSSIAQHIHILLSTKLKEYKFDNEYGAEIWKHDFAMIENSSEWKKSIEQSVRRLIQHHETRLNKIKVSIDFTQVESEIPYKRMKQKLTIFVEGYLFKTNEHFRFSQEVFMSPFSFE